MPHFVTITSIFGKCKIEIVKSSIIKALLENCKTNSLLKRWFGQYDVSKILHNKASLANVT